MSGSYALLGTFPDAPACTILSSGKTYLIGRSLDCQIVLRGLTVSRAHAEIRVTDDAAIVVDRGSANGTFVDGVQVTEAVLKVGQQLRFGNVDLVLACNEAAKIATESTLPQTEHFPSKPTTISHEQARGLLSPAQYRVFLLIPLGLPRKLIASSLGLSKQTVNNHMKEIYSIFQIRSRAEFMAKYYGSQGATVTLPQPAVSDRG
jgi:DNA-binding CsgD family transcriptional regulator